MIRRIFLSYPRIADERGAVSDIRAHLERELQIQTGDRDIHVFQDRSDIEGGDPWSRRIEAELDQASVLVLFLCPLWLTSQWCVRELRHYYEAGLAEGQDRAVVPLLWETTESRHARTDEQAKILAWIQSRQGVPWQSLRHQDSSYKGYRDAIAKLAAVIAARLPDQRA